MAAGAAHGLLGDGVPDALGGLAVLGHFHQGGVELGIMQV